MIADGAEVHADAFVHESAWVDAPSTIGAGAKLWHFVHVLAHTQIGAGSSLGQNVMAGPHVRVGTGCKIQNNVALYKGVTLEDDVFCGPSCVFAAGAVVTRDVPDYALMAGVPARRIGWVSRSGDRLGADLICPRTAETYKQDGDTLRLVSE